MLGRSQSSTKLSGEHLNDRRTGATSSGDTANILPSTLKTRSDPHCTFSVARGNPKQCRRNSSMSIILSWRPQLRPRSNHDHLGVSHAKATALHVSLRAAARKRTDHGVFAALLSRFPETPIDKRGLHAPAAILRKSCGAKQCSDTRFPHDGASRSPCGFSVHPRQKT